MRTQPGCSILLVLTAVATSSCSRTAVPSPPEVSHALRAAVEAKRPAFAAEDGDRGHHVWQEAQRFYLVYFTAWEENGVLQRIPDVYGLDHRHSAAANSP